MKLSEPLITAPNTLLMNMHMPSACSRTIKQDYSASQQLLLSQIPAFIYNYTQRSAVSVQPSLMYLGVSDFSAVKRDFTYHHQQQYFRLNITPLTKVMNKEGACYILCITAIIPQNINSAAGDGAAVCSEMKW